MPPAAHNASMRLAALLIGATNLLAAADKKPPPPPGFYANDHIEVTAEAIIDKDGIQKALGAEMPPGIVVVSVKVRPHTEKALRVGPDDFTLLYANDGQRAQPFSPGQIAGRGSIKVKSTADRGGVFSGGAGPVWGGMGTGRPQRAGGDGIGTGGGVTGAEATVNSGVGEKDNPLLAILKEKILADKETEDVISGLLYFPLDAKKIKLKDLTLLYRGPAGRFAIPFVITK